MRNAGSAWSPSAALRRPPDALRSCVDHADAMLRIKIARCLVVNVGKVTQRFSRVRRGGSAAARRDHFAKRRPVSLQRGHGIAPQCVGGRGRDEPRLRPRDFHCPVALKIVLPSLARFSRRLASRGRACAGSWQGDGRRSTGTVFVGELQRSRRRSPVKRRLTSMRRSADFARQRQLQA